MCVSKSEEKRKKKGGGLVNDRLNLGCVYDDVTNVPQSFDYDKSEAKLDQRHDPNYWECTS